MDKSVYRQIPKMDRLLEAPAIMAAADGLPRATVREALQVGLDGLREELSKGAPLPEEDALIASLAARVLAAGRYRLRRVVNATGVVLHTNLGRAPLGDEISAHVASVAGGYSTLEYDVEGGSRGSRNELVEALLCRLTGAEAALVVNNNAAAVFLMLNTLAKGKTVAVSRGELVEIGGAFRVPEIMAASGAALHEIGTTNKTRASDYESALEGGETGAILKVHTSNFRITGFTEEVAVPQLHDIAARVGVPLLYDLGAGFLVRPEALGLHEGVYVPDAVKYADVVCFSGDKLFGAGQAGIILGRRELIDRMKRNQLSRMLRVDKLTLAALEAVLRLYGDTAAACRELPVLRMLSTPLNELSSRAEALVEGLRAVRPDMSFEAVPCRDEPGGGSLPGVELDGYAVAVCSDVLSPDGLGRALRTGDVPIVARISRDRLLLSVRTLLKGDAEDIKAAFMNMGADK